MTLRFEDVLWDAQQGDSSVFRGRMVFSNDAIALKRFRYALDDNMRNEIELLTNLTHSHLVRFKGLICDANGAGILVMDFVDGTSLRHILTSKGPLSLSVGRHVSKQLVEAVAFLHSKGVAHRDIKVDNIIIMGDSDIKLVDFGACTKENSGICPPEISDGCRDPFKIDVWYIGLVISEMLCGTASIACDIDALSQSVSDEKVSHVLRCCLLADPKSRIEAADLLSLPWLSEPVDTPLDHLNGEPYLKPPGVEEDPDNHRQSHFKDPLEGMTLNPDDHPILVKYPTPQSRIALMEKLAITLKSEYGITRNDIDFYSYEQMSRHLYWISGGRYPADYEASVRSAQSISYPAVDVFNITAVFPVVPEENMLSLSASNLASETDALLN